MVEVPVGKNEPVFAYPTFCNMIVIMKSKAKIGIYVHRPAELIPYDADYPAIAAQIAYMIKNELPFIIVEHIGSTAVPNCDGKGVIDLMVLYPKGRLEIIKETLHSLGFRPQPHREPFPEERPMRVGSITYNNKVFQIHIHVIQQGHPESLSTIKFRDELRRDHRLMQKYIRCKNQILQSGMTDSLEYCRAKQVFIENVLADNRC